MKKKTKSSQSSKQIRVTESIRRKLKVESAKRGISICDFLEQLLALSR